MAAALDQEMLCVHLLDTAGRRAGPPPFGRASASRRRCWPSTTGCRSASTAAAPGWPPSWPTSWSSTTCRPTRCPPELPPGRRQRRASTASGPCRSSGTRRRARHRDRLRVVRPGRPDSERLELVRALRRATPPSAIERERLLAEVSAAATASSRRCGACSRPSPVPTASTAGWSRRCGPCAGRLGADGGRRAGRRARGDWRSTTAGEAAPSPATARPRGCGRRPRERARRTGADVGARLLGARPRRRADRFPDGRAALVAHLVRRRLASPATPSTCSTTPAGRSRLAIEREALEVRPAGRPTALRRSQRHPAGVPLAAEPRAADAADRHPGLRVDA